ncbi:hypothetical protein [Streptomyces sp. TRM75561]|uniref:hypothetical protein n=1 Tax=Streptomyces sp. TRM75561 TaxID=2975269 RepID=UPI00244B92F0|nr:hypothetical protein [Streptomyces sp. TRM75561]MDH3039089.1 hypothetical protein [Streptomyces sp. TRM75561]
MATVCFDDLPRDVVRAVKREADQLKKIAVLIEYYDRPSDTGRPMRSAFGIRPDTEAGVAVVEETRPKDPEHEREQAPAPRAFLDTPRSQTLTPPHAGTTSPATAVRIVPWQRSGEPVAFLRAAVDAAVERVVAQAGTTHDAFTADPGVLDCVDLMEAMLAQLYPAADTHDTDRPGRHAIRPATIVDDLAAGSLQAEDRLVPGGTWAPVSSVDQIVTALHQAGRGSIALLLEQGRKDIGHALLYAHIGTHPDGRTHIVRVDPQARRPVETLRDQAQRWIRAGRGTRMIVINPTGRAADLASLPARPQSTTLAQALVDAPTSHHYGMLGVELETEFEVDSPNVKEHFMKAPTLRLVSDTGLDGQSIIEVTSSPMKVHSRETSGLSADDVFSDVALILQRLSDVPPGEKRLLSDVFPDNGRFTIEDHESKIIGKVDPRNLDEGLSIHFTAGVPLASLYSFLEFVLQEGRARAVNPAIRTAMANLDQGLKFGHKVRTEYLGQHRGEGSSRSTALESTALAGFTALVYTHLAALLRSYYVQATSPDDEVVIKNYTPVLSRNPLSVIRQALSPRVIEHLKKRAGDISKDMEKHFIESNRPVSFVLKEKYKRPDFDLPLLEIFPPGDPSPAGYVSDALHPEHNGRVFSPDDVFGLMTTFEELDNSGIGIPLVLLEIRFFGADHKPDLRIVRQYYDKIAKTLRDLYDRELSFLSRSRTADS